MAIKGNEWKVSLLDNDLYKFTMAQVVFHHFNNVNVKYQFKCRNLKEIKEICGGQDFVDSLINFIEEFKSKCNVTIKPEEIYYLHGIRFMKEDFVEFLRNFKLDPKYIKTEIDPLEYEPIITIEGPWIQTIWWEVILLSVISEWYSNIMTDDYGMEKIWASVDKRIKEFSELPDDIVFSDFGTRRRFDKRVHNIIVANLAHKLTGTSNVELAMTHHLTPIGTMAHEYIQAMQVFTHPMDSQRLAFEYWFKEYHGDLGIALSDCFTLKKFIEDFNGDYSRLYDGVRHDSGDPFVWGDAMIEMYKDKKIDSSNKTLVFSDGLDIKSIINIQDYFRNKPIKVSFGIGTNLTNNLFNDLYPTMKNVIKMVECKGRPIIKVSDNPAKVTCINEKYKDYIMDCLKNYF